MATSPYWITERELQVVRLAADGYANKEIGKRLGISGDTAKHHLDVLSLRWGQHRRTRLVVEAMRQGLLPYYWGDTPVPSPMWWWSRAA